MWKQNLLLRGKRTKYSSRWNRTWPCTNPCSIIKFLNHASKGRWYSKIAGASWTIFARKDFVRHQADSLGNKNTGEAKCPASSMDELVLLLYPLEKY
jgi:hypothetical protein